MVGLVGPELSPQQWVDLIKSLDPLIWPAVILGVGWMLRSELRSLLGRTTTVRAEAFNSKFEMELAADVAHFEQGAQKVAREQEARSIEQESQASLPGTGGGGGEDEGTEQNPSSGTSPVPEGEGPSASREELSLLLARSASPTESLHMLSGSIGLELARLQETSGVQPQGSMRLLISALEIRGVLTHQVADTLREFFALIDQLRTGVSAESARTTFDSGMLMLKTLQAMKASDLVFGGERYYLHLDPDVAENTSFTTPGGVYDHREKSFLLLNRRGSILVQAIGMPDRSIWLPSRLPG